MRQKSFREKLEIELRALLLATVIVASTCVVLYGSIMYMATASAHYHCGNAGGELIQDACVVDGVAI